MQIDGQCHCGRIRFDAEIDPDRVRICHCTDCQQLSGSAFVVAAPVEETKFRLRAGQPKIYVKTSADSGTPRAQAFCADCGSRLYATSVGEGPRQFGLRLGVIRQRDQLAPKRQFWCASALDWLDDIPGLPALDRE